MWPNIRLPSSLEETTPDPAIRSEFEDGSVQTRPRFTRMRRRWTLSWANIKKSQYEILREFYMNQKGGSLSFSWTNPMNGGVFTVRFVGELTAKTTEVDFYAVTVKLEQV